ncbi:hypothetical protein [Clostridium sp.]|uniref:hypothetical protein n=1 Tax=Clostridium sp. TaxID=1506 RepID=UPI0039922422
MNKNRLKENHNFLMEIISQNNVDEYLKFINIDLNNKFEVDLALTEFNIMMKKYNQDFNNPVEFLEYSLRQYLKLSEDFAMDIDILRMLRGVSNG